MSSISRTLHRHFSTTTTTLHPQSIKSISTDLYKERDLRKLVDKFKFHSTSDRFRSKSGIFTTTIRRLAAAKRFRWIQEILDHQTQFTHDISKENFTIRLIKLYSQSGMFENALQLFDEMPQRKCPRTVKSMNALLSACVDCREYGKIEKLFVELQGELKVVPDVFSYNISIKGFCEGGELGKAVEMFREMKVSPDLVTYNTLLDGFYKCDKKFDEGEEMWNDMVRNGFVPNVRSYNARIGGLVNVKRFDEAVELVGEMEKRGVKLDVFSFSVLVRGYCEAGDLSEVKKWYAEMGRSGFVADRGLFDCVLRCACEKGDWVWCFELCEEVFKRKVLVDGGVLQKVVDMLVKAEKIEEAKKVVEMGKSNDYRLYKLNLAPEV